MNNQLTFAQLKKLVARLDADPDITDDVVIAADCCAASVSGAHVLQAGTTHLGAFGSRPAIVAWTPQLRWMKGFDGITRKTLVFESEADYVSRVFRSHDDDTEGEDE